MSLERLKDEEYGDEFRKGYNMFGRCKQVELGKVEYYIGSYVEVCRKCV